MSIRSIIPFLIRLCLVTVVLGVAGMAAPRIAQAEMTLVMVEEPGCMWCARWHAEVGPEYPITPEGLAAPLHRVTMGAPQIDDLTLISAPVYTPTFLLIDEGQEVGRIEGYPGEEFFWWQLGQLLDRADPDWAAPTIN